MKLAGVASSLPGNRFRQNVLMEALGNIWAEQLSSPALFERIHSRTGVEYRHLALPLAEYENFKGWGQRNKAWLEVAQDLGERAIDAALARSGFARREMGALVVTSVTGIASPSLDAHLINRMSLPTDIKRTPMFGLGCVGGAVGLTRAADHVRAYPHQVAVLLAVEICSLTLQLGDLTTANLIATGLFADGAAAVVIAGAERGCDGPEIAASRSFFYPQTEDIMGWDISERGFQVLLSPRLPALIRERLARDVETFLSECGLCSKDISNWILHPGGPKVLDAIRDALQLSERDLAISWDCLRRFGNLSSASVLLVLEETMLKRSPTSGSYGLLIAMGPGFCAEMILIQW
ncbi:MAG: type III polyketide synthase [Candidatus Binataceae bacterium]|nr:type III polyketide synthase [Candidatus Binataceae bacterium]